MTRHIDRSLLRKVRRATDRTSDYSRTASSRRLTIARRAQRIIKGGR